MIISVKHILTIPIFKGYDSPFTFILNIFGVEK